MTLIQERVGLLPIPRAMESTYATHLVAKGMAESTIRNYQRKVDHAVLWFAAADANLAGATPTDLAAWASNFPPTHASQRQAKVALLHYYDWIQRPNPALSAIRVPPKPRYFCQAATEREASLLERRANTEGHPRGTVVMAGLYLALRAREIAGMRWDRFDHHLTQYTVHGKNGLVATLPVHDLLARYLDRNRSAALYLFPGRTEPHAVYATIWQWVRDLAEDEGIHEFRPHQLRHTSIQTFYRATGDLRLTADFARHARLETTMIYTGTTKEDLRAGVAKLNFR